MVAIEKKKTKKDEKNNNNLHMLEPPWVYKPMPYSMSVLSLLQKWGVVH